MLEETTSQNSKEKEIDLLDMTGKMFSGIGKGISALFHWIQTIIGKLFRFALKHWWILAICTVLGGVAGYLKATFQKPYFETEMLVETQIIPRAQIADRINNLQLLIRDNSNIALAKVLGIPEKEVKDIFFIKADLVNVKVDRVKSKTDSVEEELGPQFLRIRIRVWENHSIARMEQALEKFIEADPYTQERLEVFRRNNLAQQAAIEGEIEQLQLFQKKNIEKSSSVMTSGAMPLMVQNEERTYVGEILDLKNQILNLQAAYDLTRPLSIIQPFTPFENPVDKRLKNMVIFAFLFFVAGYSILLFRESGNRI